MAYEDRSYSGSAVQTTITANINSTATTIPIAASTGWPDGSGGPFHAAIAPANDPEAFSEVIRCSGRTGLTLNVQTTPISGRGWDGTTPLSHLTGAIIAHVATATDLDEANQHISNTGLDHHSQYLTVARHDVSARHGASVLPLGGTPSSSVVGDTSSSGTSSLIPRSDHRHAREGFGSPVATGNALSAGVSTSLARADHVHTDTPIICTSTTRPANPWEGLTIIETDTGMIQAWVSFNGIWNRIGNYFANGRTEFEASRSPIAIPSGGLSTFLTWDGEARDRENMVPSNGSSSIITVPNILGASGVWVLTIRGNWGAVFPERSYVEIMNHGTSYRQLTTGEDFFSHSIAAFVGAGANLQVGVHQQSGVDQTITVTYTGFKIIT